jgi:hypothetical protein
MKEWIGTKRSCLSILVRLRHRRKLSRVLQKNKNLAGQLNNKAVVKNKIAVMIQRVKTTKRVMR